MTRALLLLSFCSLAIAQSSVSSSASDWRFAHPDADMKMSVNVQALLKSDAFAKGVEQAKTQAKDNAMAIQMGIAMLQGVDRLSVSLRQKAPNDADVLAQVTGSFDPQFIAGMFPSTGKSQVKVVGPHTILIGEGDSFTQAAARMSGSAAPASGDDLEQSDIWIQVSGAMIAQQAGQQGSPMMKDVRGLSVGLTFGEAPVVNMVLTAADAAGAATLLGTFQAMTPLLAAYPASAAAAKSLSLKQDGSKLRMHLVIPPEVVAMLQQQAASAASSGGTTSFSPMTLLGLAPSSKLVPPPPPPPAQNGGKVMIYGLDDGTKEIAAPK